MTVPKTALVAAALLLAAAAAEWPYMHSAGPYDHDPDSSLPHYLLWFPPYAVPMNLSLLNVTWFRPEAIWFKGTYLVNVYTPEWSGYKQASIYVVQDGVYVRRNTKIPYDIVAGFVEWHVRDRCRQGIAMVAPNKIIVLNATAQVWISDVCLLLVWQQVVLAETSAIRPRRRTRSRGGGARQPHRQVRKRGNVYRHTV